MVECGKSDVKSVSEKADAMACCISCVRLTCRQLSSAFLPSLLNSAVLSFLFLFPSPRSHFHSLVYSRPLLPVHAAESRNADFDFDARVPALVASAGPHGLPWPNDCAHDFGVAHLEIAAPVGGGLRCHLAVNPSELVPSPPVDAQMREGVG